jgi:HEAT repeat protein
VDFEFEYMTIYNKPMRTAVFVLLILGFLLPHSALGQSGEEEEVSSRSLYETWEQSLLYGIDSSVMATIDEMVEQKDDHFSREVLALLNSRRVNLRTKALDFFEALESDDAIETVLRELDFYQDLTSSFLIRLIYHLQRRDHPIDDDLWNLLREIIDEEGRDVRMATIRYLGESAYADAAEFLTGLYEDSDTDASVREAILRALGGIRDEASAELIFDLATDVNIDKTQRIAALEAAGKFADDRAIDVLGEAFSSDDPLIRTAAIGSLQDFPVDAVKELYLEALRDSFWRIRLTALRGISENPFAEALPAMEYMARQDPETNIKVQAYRSIAALDTGDGWRFLREEFTDTSLAEQYRQVIAAELIAGNFTASKTEIQEVMVEQWEEENSRLLDTICKTMSTSDISGAGDLFERMLGHENFIIQIYGVRGIGRNGISRYREDLQAIIDSESTHPALKSNASSALDQL